MKDGKPTLCVLGHGRAGKDTACLWFNDNTILRFAGGSSWSAASYMGSLLGKTAEEAYRDRHKDRMFWFEELNKLRAREGSTCLIKKCLEHSDLVCGLRNRAEIIQGRHEGLLDLVVWVENKRVEVDPTVEFSIEDADIVVLNNTSLEDFYGRLRRLAKVLGVLTEGN